MSTVGAGVGVGGGLAVVAGDAVAVGAAEDAGDGDGVADVADDDAAVPLAPGVGEGVAPGPQATEHASARAMTVANGARMRVTALTVPIRSRPSAGCVCTSSRERWMRARDTR